MRAAYRSLGALFLAAVAAAAAFAHYAIDVVGDYALPHDTYDDVAHASREVLAIAAVVIALGIGMRALRRCCELGAAHRLLLVAPALSWKACLPFAACTAVLASIVVPVMELIDARAAGASIDDLGDAFGGSILLGLGVTIACAAVVAFFTFALARWLVSHRERIVAIVVSLVRLRANRHPNSRHRRLRTASPSRRRHLHARSLCKRGPPDVAAITAQHLTARTKGDPCASFSFPRDARLARHRADGRFRHTGERRDAGRPDRQHRRYGRRRDHRPSPS
ncbi:MAG TPA: hypothetical protein VMH02_04975 [Verrucomicrobiae bacterium]|nr:hypothetical protein [Verrucomicrobiae bacterium]